MERTHGRAAADDRTSRVPRGRLSAPLVGSGLALAAIVVAAILVLTPLTQAAQSTSSVTSVKPFVGKVTTARSLAYLGCGTTAKITKLPKFSLKTGVEVLAEKTTAKPCASPLGYNTATTTGDAGMWGKPFTTFAGVHHVVVHWTVRWASTITAHLGTNQALGQGSASTDLLAVLYLVDESNGTYLPAANSWGSVQPYRERNGRDDPKRERDDLPKPDARRLAHVLHRDVDLRLERVVRGIDRRNTASATVSLANSGGGTVLTSIVRS